MSYVLKMVLLLLSFTGLVFLPDSIGYFIGTNFFGAVAKQIGRWFRTRIGQLKYYLMSKLIQNQGNVIIMNVYNHPEYILEEINKVTIVNYHNQTQ